MARTSPTNAGRRHATVLRTLLALAALAAAAGCAESSRPTATGEGWIRGMKGHGIDLASAKFKDGDTLPITASVDGLIIGDRIGTSDRDAPSQAVIH